MLFLRYENNREIRVKVQRKAGGLVARLRVEDNRFYKIQNTKYAHKIQNMLTKYKICTQNTKYVHRM